MLKKELERSLIKRGEVYWVRLDPAEAAEIKKTRPAVIITNNEQNTKSKVVMVAPISKKVKNIYLTFQVPIHLKGELMKVKCEQIRAIGKHRIIGKKIATLTETEMAKISQIIKEVLSLD
ncbi:plasmid maintenance toxin/Cell growth inhibitor [Glomus cerebriforme]|uniref:Plasmid maintenance toxin/Cell growth inhibitor n=1 Tax=Glomus cerebriforme TaxID=658196 RepID=A0A397SCM8_9GLOM|nr:plasmid maintenance toxin/Cell growth inhibitor [Glomus cerebriforme]